MEFRILGPIEARDGERLLTPVAPRQRALLGVLLLHAGETVSRDALVDAVWGDTRPRRPETALRTEVQGLRRALEPERAADEASLLVVDDGGLRLPVG
jgi:DNA-binding SARP family transcriptional activator